MPGCGIGWAVNLSLIVESRSTLSDDVIVDPEAIAKSLKRELEKVRLKIPGSDREHRVMEVHVSQVGASLASVRLAMGLNTPWARRTPKRNT